MSECNVIFNFDKSIGKIKPMHAVNNGPYPAKNEQKRGNSNDYRAARIPYARNHDASFDAGYGGNHTVDVNFIFPNFDADVNDPQSYDFACTDRYVQNTYDVGTEVFYRLGSRIEHEVKKYNTIPPKDFKKWAEICEHIIMHYTEGWANGFNYKLDYWEIWNEPDLDVNEPINKRCWGGTEIEFFELYKTAALHLKNRFPYLKIGGPASCGDEAWLERFLKYQSENNVPMDFVSWHWYWTEPKDMSIKCTRVRRLMEKYGYGSAESIMNEWNYVRGWVDEFVYSIEQIISMKGAAFFSACMLEAQNNPDVDMLMYYDARMGAFNGLFDYYTMRPLKGYYSFYLFANLYELGSQAYSSSDDEDVYVVGASNKDKKAAIITYYAENDNKWEKYINVDLGTSEFDGAKILVVDENKTLNEYTRDKIKDGKVRLFVQRNSIIYIER